MHKNKRGYSNSKLAFLLMNEFRLQSSHGMRVSHNGKLIDEIAGSVKIIDDLKEQGHLDPSLAL